MAWGEANDFHGKTTMVEYPSTASCGISDAGDKLYIIREASTGYGARSDNDQVYTIA